MTYSKKQSTGAKKMKDKFIIFISAVALIISGVSAYYSHKAFSISKILNDPFLDARLEKFASGSYFLIENGDKDIFLKIQFELTNTGNVPVTILSAGFRKIEAETTKIPYPILQFSGHLAP
jgi:hypothetical protein